MNWILYRIPDCLCFPQIFNFSFNKKKYNQEKNEKNINIKTVKYKLKYASKDNIPSVLNGLGIVIVSTPKGVMTGQAAKAQNIGGEVLCSVS